MHSKVNQLSMYTPPFFCLFVCLFRFLPHIGRCRVLSRVLSLCVIQQFLINYLFLYIVVCICQSQSLSLSLPLVFAFLINTHWRLTSGLATRTYSSYGWKFVHFDQHFPLSPTLPAPGNHRSTLCFYEFSFLRFHIEVRIYNISRSLSDLFHFA